MKPQCVIEAVSNYYQNITSNINRGDYQLANIVDKAYEEVRKTVAEFINCQSREIVFTSGTTHALNQIAFGYGLKYLKEDDEILISLAEHASNTLPWYRVAEKQAVRLNLFLWMKQAKSLSTMSKNVK